jgi:hypothetical protein
MYVELTGTEEASKEKQGCWTENTHREELDRFGRGPDPLGLVLLPKPVLHMHTQNTRHRIKRCFLYNFTGTRSVCVYKHVAKMQQWLREIARVGQPISLMLGLTEVSQTKRP